MDFNSLSAAYGSHHLNLHHIIPLDFEAVGNELPDSYAWVPLDDITTLSSEYCCPLITTNVDHHHHHVELGEVPVIDLDLAESSNTRKKLVGLACETWGTFQVTNHGVPLTLVHRVESHCRHLFSLPTSEKLKVLRSPDGATGYGLPRISPFFSKLMWHEGFTIMGSTSLVEHARQLWPRDYTNFCEVMEQYDKEMKKLAERIMNLILDSLGITREELQWKCSNDFTTTATGAQSTAIQLNSYPACPDPKRAMGLAPHTDTSLFTILHQTGASGLQIHKNGVGWVTVPSLAGALTVNVGDLLHILSNARFPTVLHRALVNQRHHRYSIAYFYGPPTDARITPFTTKLVGQGHDPPRYRSVTRREYIGIKANNLNNALSLIRL